ncbi:MAG: D-alanyl-D-alanine carboxypeptidase [Actinobacteria bacterium]|nr:D-alanyl-D-alanine carboxypeptidase [Actinomycetota bacterium]
MQRAGRITIVTVAVLASLLMAIPPVAADPGKQPRIDTLLQRRLHDPRLGSNVAMIVIDADTGGVLSKHSADRPMHTASNMKIVTAVTALAAMGPDTRFVTRVRAGASAKDVILQGAGDPLLSNADLSLLASRTAERLTRGAAVTVHVDGDLFPAPSKGPGWKPNYLGYQVAAVQALARRGDRGRQPSLAAATAFTSALRARGIKATLGRNADAAPHAAVLARVPGHTVAKAVGVMLSESESNVAEVLFRHVAIAAGRKPTWAGARRAARETLVSLGLDPTGMVLADGSGLSRDVRLTPRFIVDVLRVAKVTQRKRFATMFAASAMPIAGRTGTLTTRYGRYSTSPSSCARGDVQAKTGTLVDTIALSGVAKTAAGGRRLFSIIVNDRPMRFSALSTRRAVDGLAATITGCWH